MSVILVLVGFSVVVAVGFLVAFFWSVRTGQYDDTYSSSVRILFEDEKPAESTSQAALIPENPVDHSPNQI
jgi:cbb3-type cytochrome oxidase maturation protein